MTRDGCGGGESIGMYIVDREILRATSDGDVREPGDSVKKINDKKKLEKKGLSKKVFSTMIDERTICIHVGSCVLARARACVCAYYNIITARSAEQCGDSVKKMFC